MYSRVLPDAFLLRLRDPGRRSKINAQTAALQPLIRRGGTAPGWRRSSAAAELP